VLINTSLRPFAPFYRRLRPANYAALLELALGAGAAQAREETVLRLTSRVLHPACEPGTSILAEWIAYRREHPVSRANAVRQLLAAARYRAPAARPPTPMLVLASARDRLVDPRCSRALAGVWSAAYVEHPTAGHDLPLDDGGWVADRVREWLAEAVPAPTRSA
jgi:pimeloyl-ACP methyl ester carboxylesterase